MVLHGTLLLISATIFGCIAASISSECERRNRKSASYYLSDFKFDPLTDCGRCLDGYTEKNGHCVLPRCPSAVYCNDLRRNQCTSHTHGKCGVCYDEYYEVEGICVTEDEVKKVLADVERVLRLESSDVEESLEDGAQIKEQTKGEKAEAINQEAETRVKEAENKNQEVATEQTSINNNNHNGSEFIDKKSDSEIEVNEGQIRIDDEVLGEEPSADDTPSDVLPVKPADDKRAGERADSADVRLDNVKEEEKKKKKIAGIMDIKFFAVVMSVSLISLVTITIASVCAYRAYHKKKLTDPVEYQGYGGGDNKSSVSRSESGDRKLAHSAQMYHYQHHKQQMMALEKSQTDDTGGGSDNDEEVSDSEDGKYRVYECPGLAPTGEMEVQNPLFLQNSSNPPSGKPSPVSSVSPPFSPRSDRHSATSSD